MLSFRQLPFPNIPGTNTGNPVRNYDPNNPPVWQPSSGGGYYDATGQIKQTIPGDQLYQYGGTLNGQPVLQGGVVDQGGHIVGPNQSFINSSGQIAQTDAYGRLIQPQQSQSSNVIGTGNTMSGAGGAMRAPTIDDLRNIAKQVADKQAQLVLQDPTRSAWDRQIAEQQLAGLGIQNEINQQSDNFSMPSLELLNRYGIQVDPGLRNYLAAYNPTYDPMQWAMTTVYPTGQEQSDTSGQTYGPLNPNRPSGAGYNYGGAAPTDYSSLGGQYISQPEVTTQVSGQILNPGLGATGIQGPIIPQAPPPPVWAPSSAGQNMYYDSTGRIQGAIPYNQLSNYGGTFTNGSTVPSGWNDTSSMGFDAYGRPIYSQPANEVDPMGYYNYPGAGIPGFMQPVQQSPYMPSNMMMPGASTNIIGLGGN